MTSVAGKARMKAEIGECAGKDKERILPFHRGDCAIVLSGMLTLQ
jgi:hypothetical protein